MSQTVREKSKPLARVRHIQGQAAALERGLGAEKGCGEVLHQIAATRGAIDGLMAKVIKEYVQFYVADPVLDERERREGAAELIDVIRTYVK